jgi:uncharacterized phage protein (TIGR01671 family)
MREIEFRGKKSCDDEWVYGGIIFVEPDDALYGGEDIPFIKPIADIDYEVIPETVGQYTGLKDKNDVKIFEGDIVNIRTPEFLPQKVPDDGPFVINWEQFSCSFMVFDKKSGDLVPISWFNGDLDKLNIEIIGNLWDNPELVSRE